MKTAILTVKTFEVECPYCGEVLTDKHYGSFMWEVDDFYAGEIDMCPICESEFKLPLVVKNNRLPIRENDNGL